MKRLFCLAPEAKNDFREILSDIAEDSPETAERIRVEFVSELTKLGQHPGMGHYHEELLSRKYRFWKFHNYVIVYAWESKPIRMASFVHGARDLSMFLSLRIGREN